MKEELERSRLAWVIRLRSVVTLVLVGLAIVTAPVRDVWFRVVPVIGIAALVFAANALWSILLSRKRIPIERLALYQCLFDIFVVSIGVYQFGTSGAAGFLYLLVIITSGVLLPRDKTLYMAGAASAVYFLLIFMETYRYFIPIPPAQKGEGLLETQLPHADLLVNLGVKVFFFYLVALACANLQDLLGRFSREADFLARFNRSVIEAIPVGVLVLDSTHSVIRMNAAMARTLLLSSETAALGKHLGEILPGIGGEWDRGLAKIEHDKQEVRLLGATVPLSNSRTMRANVRMQPILEQGEVLGVVLTFQLASKTV